MDHKAGPSGEVVIFARPEDPVTSRFAQFARQSGLFIWQPERLDDVGWSVHLEGPCREVLIHDRLTGRRWRSEDLAGIWYQALPPLSGLDALEERDRRYATAEFSSAIRALGQEASCIVVGQPPPDCPTGLFDFGLESRLRLRSFGLPVLSDWIGPISILRSTLNDVPATHVRISRIDGGDSLWLADLNAGSADSPQSPLRESDLVAATLSDNRSARVALHVDDEVIVIDIDDSGIPSPASWDKEVEEIEAITRRVHHLTSAKAGIIYFGHQDEGWRIARLSLQVPYWLADLAESWLFPRMVTLFQSKSLRPLGTGSPI